jgi:RHH-type proline utilization regulon transcriptional repressor/proline dehydrogenase/delta 1-pyrroline-5-carboxylate dehydrogenase
MTQVAAANQTSGKREPGGEISTAEISDAHLRDESAVIESLINRIELDKAQQRRIEATARRLVHAVRAGRRPVGGIDAFMQEYDLSTDEGVILMCLAEALLRIPDGQTVDRLIKDKIGDGEWDDHIGKSESLFVNASTWGLMLTGRIVNLAPDAINTPSSALRGLISKSGEPIIRQAVLHAIRILGRQFVLGRTIEEALDQSQKNGGEAYRYSFDMLGEAAMTQKDADHYFDSYMDAIRSIGARTSAASSIFESPSISVKLSALHPRYEQFQANRVLRELGFRLVALGKAARDANIGLTVDAEESDRLHMMLKLFEKAARDPDLDGWSGLGLAVQAYQKRTLPILDFLGELSQRTNRRIPVRLVKGAYWDTEIKRAQELGLANYPVFTRKTATDVSYIAAAHQLLQAPERFYPQFATHNAHTIAAVIAMAGENADYELQRLHGMGGPLYEEVVDPSKINKPARIYAPVGSHEDLLAYLVRRLLENGANTSFVHRLADDESPISKIIEDPIQKLQRFDAYPHPKIPVPSNIFGDERANSAGVALYEPAITDPLLTEIKSNLSSFEAFAENLSDAHGAKGRIVCDPADNRRAIGSVQYASADDARHDVVIAKSAAEEWNNLGGAKRAAILNRAADLMEKDRARLMALCIREAGKTIPNALGEIREAVDFLRYYACRANREFEAPTRLTGPTGETNEFALRGRGVFVCISPWNFPMAIFAGQVSAALAAGNAVVAKPAEQTTLCAKAIADLFHKAGVPADVLRLTPGEGSIVGEALVNASEIAGVAFTGSTTVARRIQQQLSLRNGPIAPLIAETGGMNAMIVDSSALPEQVVKHAVESAFDSAGQRCSAARILFVQSDVSDKIQNMLIGAMAELVVGDPIDLATDIGPVIDQSALDKLKAHAQAMEERGALLYKTPMNAETKHGTFMAPHLFGLEDLSSLTEEVFGPCLHVVRYEGDKIEEICDAINDLGYGLTMSVHSRIDDTVNRVRARAKVGNLYVNRNQIGAVVGVQPFGGEGLSGTGPKAGGPRYLHRFATERTVSTDTTASGGNAALMTLRDTPDMD